MSNKFAAVAIRKYKNGYLNCKTEIIIIIIIIIIQ